MPPTPIVPCQSTCTPWALPADLCEPCSKLTLDPTLVTTCLQAASDVLFELTGRQYAGSCQDTIRPAPRSLIVDHGRPIRPVFPYGGAFGYWSPAGGGGFQTGWGMSQCNRTDRGGCTAVPEVTLGVFPLTSIVQVKIDGAVVDPATYTVDDNRWLVRLTDPNNPGARPGWPCCQDMTYPSTAVGTWEVTFTYGSPPPPMGVLACAELACHLALALTPSAQGACKLPQRVTSIVRQGVSMVVLDPMVFLDKGRTGLTICDEFITSKNPHGLTRRATCSNPDLRRRTRRRTV